MKNHSGVALLEVNDVNVRFGGIHAVKDVNLAVDAGQITGLIGPNGAGKTTLFNVITGVQPPTTGTVAFDGDDISSQPTYKRARRGIARTFQRLEVFGSLTARDNILMAAELRHSRLQGKDPGALTDAILERVGISSVADSRVDAMPTGQARLVELGRCLAIEPRLLLLDEPASGQSEQETEVFSSLLMELAEEGLAILLVEHDVPLVMRVCSTIYVLHFGEILASGTASEIQQNQQVLDAYLGQEALA